MLQLGLIILLIVLLLCIIYRNREHLSSPVLKISFRIDSGVYSLIVYDDKTISKTISRSDGSTLITKNYTPDIDKWWAAMRIMNFPFQKTNICPSGPINYVLEFSGKKINIGCGPAHIYNDISALFSE
jgi:hypothetical protein